jgi:HlyD family secretion protein
MLTKYILPLVAVAGVIFAVVFVRAGNKPVPSSIPVAEPARAPFADYVAGAGIVEPSSENIDIGIPEGGVVTKLDHWIGDHVKAGDVLFRIDPRDQDAELKVRQADLVSAQANVNVQQAAVADADDQWEKVKELGPKAMSQEDLDKRKFAAQQAEAKLSQAKADVISAQASIEATQTELDRRIIRAPIDGTILQCKIHVGEFAAAPSMIADADPLMVLLSAATGIYPRRSSLYGWNPWWCPRNR